MTVLDGQNGVGHDLGRDRIGAADEVTFDLIAIECLHLDTTNLVAILNELEQRGYATRTSDKEDRRRHLVEVSKKGIALIEEVSHVMDGVEDELLDGLEPARRKQLEGLLASIWERSGGYEAWSQVAVDVDDKAA